MPNFVKICQSVAKILRFFDFSRWRLPLSWIVDFAKFYWLTPSGGPDPSQYQILLKSVVLLWRYCNFSNFQNGRRRHLVFFEVEKFYWLLGLRGSRRISMPTFVEIGQ